MVMAPYFDNPEDSRPFFRAAKSLFDEIGRNYRNEKVDMEILSMGMTGDYIVALQEGSNMIRVGSGIFRKGNY